MAVHRGPDDDADDADSQPLLRSTESFKYGGVDSDHEDKWEGGHKSKRYTPVAQSFSNFEDRKREKLPHKDYDVCCL